MVQLLRSIFFDAFVRLVAWRNLRADRFGTLAAVMGVALGVATVNAVLILDVSTERREAATWSTNPDLPVNGKTVGLAGFHADGAPTVAEDAREETHEDYVIMRSTIRLGSLSAFLVGALIVFFTFAVVVERRKREAALFRSLGALPEQAAAVFVREALLIAIAGGALGMAASLPLAYVAAAAGITTTGRARIFLDEVVVPWGRMGLVSAIGGATAILGVLGPARQVMRLRVHETLADRQDPGRMLAPKTRGATLIALPFVTLLFVLLRPFFKTALPSLAFFALEAGFVVGMFLATITLVPDLVRRGGALLVRFLPGRSAPEPLLIRRRIERGAHGLGWSVSAIMMVFALLLALHLATLSLKREVERWAVGAVDRYAFVTSNGSARTTSSAEAVLPLLPEDLFPVRFTSRTPWPNAVQAVDGAALREWAKILDQPELTRIAEAFGPGRTIVSTMMARRYRLKEGDLLEISGTAEKRRFVVAGVTDDIGFSLFTGPYRNGKTYAVIDGADAAVLDPYVRPLGSDLVLVDLRPQRAGSKEETHDWRRRLGSLLKAEARSELPGLSVFSGEMYRGRRVQETTRDFAIFDIIFVLTSLLAAIGVANQLVLGVHGRRAELALYRSLGMTSGQIRRLVLWEGAFAGLAGGILAVCLGIPLGYAAVGALRSVSAFDVSFELPLRYVGFILAASVGLATGAALYPARRASRGP